MILAERTVLNILLASLWQDALIGISVAIILRLAGSRLNATTRHAVLQVTVIAMVLTPVATTLSVVGSSVIVQGAGSVPVPVPSATSGPSGTVLFRIIDIKLSDSIVVSLNLIWLAGVMILLGRVCLGYIRMRRVLRGCTQFDRQRGVALFACTTIRTPFAAGFITPSIVIPKKIVDEGAGELQCAVLHEMAHVERRDAWTHVLERLVYAIMFFNPAIILTLRALRREREAACDDLAVSNAQDADSYVRSLASLAVRGAQDGDLVACGANGFMHPIVWRIERLEDAHMNRSTGLSRYAIVAAFAALLSIALFLQSFAPAFAFAPASAVGRSSPAALTPSSRNMKCNHEVQVVQAPVPKQGPLPGGRVVVNVLVLPSGGVRSTRVAASSGNATLDRVALSLARQATYSPAVRDCKRIAAIYKFMFSSQPQP